MAVCVLSPAGLSQNFEEARQAPAPRPMSPILRGPLASAAVGAGMCVLVLVSVLVSASSLCHLVVPSYPQTICVFVCLCAGQLLGPARVIIGHLQQTARRHNWREERRCSPGVR